MTYVQGNMGLSTIQSNLRLLSVMISTAFIFDVLVFVIWCAVSNLVIIVYIICKEYDILYERALEGKVSFWKRNVKSRACQKVHCSTLSACLRDTDNSLLQHCSSAASETTCHHDVADSLNRRQPQATHKLVTSHQFQTYVSCYVWETLITACYDTVLPRLPRQLVFTTLLIVTTAASHRTLIRLSPATSSKLTSDTMPERHWNYI